MNFDEIVKNLNTLNKIQINDKVIIKDNLLYIDKYSLCRPLLRTLNRQNREKFYLFLIKLIDELVINLDYYIEYKNIKDNKWKLPNIKNFQTFLDIQNKLLNLVNAIDNLKKTYNTDIEYCRKINLLKERINRTNPEYYSYYILRNSGSLPVIDEVGFFKDSYFI